MKKRKVNIQSLTSKLNDFINNNRGKTFSGTELSKYLTDIGFSKTISSHLQAIVFDFERVGLGRLYEIKKDQKPVYVGLIEGIYNKAAQRAMNSYNKKKEKATSIEKTLISEEDAWQLLIDKGKVKRIFDINLLKSKYPTIYLECLRYELVKP